jgi:hypothetical protein
MRTMLSKKLRMGRMWFGATVVATLAVGVLLGSSFAPGTEAEAQGTPTLTFSGGVGVIVNLVNSGNTADFEKVMRAYGETLAGSSNAQRAQMGRGFKLYRAAEMGPNNSAIYYSIFDPAVSSGNYQHITVLAEEFGGGPPGNGDEVRSLYTDYTGALAPGGSALNLNLLMEF